MKPELDGQLAFFHDFNQYFQGRIDEVRVYNRALSASEITTLFGTSALQLNWLVSDHLGTPRMIIDQTGTLANVKRHDYLPFGEELFAGTGGRTTALGYSGGDGVRQQFTQKERDNETGLDYFEARYYSSIQGRFTGADEPFADQGEDDPQSWNLYQYAGNSPLLFSDPSGRWKWVDPDNNGKRFLQWEERDNWQTLATFLNNNSNDTYYKEDLEKAFGSGGLGQETIVDVTGASPRFTNPRGGVTDTSWSLVPLSGLPKIAGTDKRYPGVSDGPKTHAEDQRLASCLRIMPSDETHEGLFVGTEEQLKALGVNSKDEEGRPKVGPIAH